MGGCGCGYGCECGCGCEWVWVGVGGVHTLLINPLMSGRRCKCESIGYILIEFYVGSVVKLL